jgi:hypothetical protein
VLGAKETIVIEGLPAGEGGHEVLAAGRVHEEVGEALDERLILGGRERPELDAQLLQPIDLEAVDLAGRQRTLAQRKPMPGALAVASW